jgi:hypothetical protein
VFAIESVFEGATADLASHLGFRADHKSFHNRSIKILNNLVSHLPRSQAVSKQV